MEAAKASPSVAGGEQADNGTNIVSRNNQQEIDLNCLPSGVRFRPTDEELIVHYLDKKVKKKPLPPTKIVDVKFYESIPQTLSETYKPVEENEWYFFTPRKKRYPNGFRPKRQIGDRCEGFWKATGADKPIKSRSNGAIIGFNRALVYYEGKPPKGDRKTDWLMHEFRLTGPPTEISKKDHDKKNMILDECVLVKLYKKGGKINGKNPLGLGGEQEQNGSELSNDDGGLKIANSNSDAGDDSLDGQLIPFNLPTEDANFHGGGGDDAQLADFPPCIDLAGIPQSQDIGYDHVMYGYGGTSNDNLLQTLVPIGDHDYGAHHHVPVVPPLSTMSPAWDSHFPADRYQSANSFNCYPGEVQVQAGSWAGTNYFSGIAGLRNQYNSGMLAHSDSGAARLVRMDQIVTAAYNQPTNNPSLFIVQQGPSAAYCQSSFSESTGDKA